MQIEHQAKAHVAHIQILGIVEIYSHVHFDVLVLAKCNYYYQHFVFSFICPFASRMFEYAFNASDADVVRAHN